MEKKDLRFEHAAKQIAEKRQALMTKLGSQPLTHEQRQALIRQPITFCYYGSKSSGGVGVCDEHRLHRVYTVRPRPFDGGDSHD